MTDEEFGQALIAAKKYMLFAANKVLLDEVDAEEAVSRAFVKALRYKGTFARGKANVHTWASRIAYNEALQMKDKQQIYNDNHYDTDLTLLTIPEENPADMESSIMERYNRVVEIIMNNKKLQSKPGLADAFLDYYQNKITVRSVGRTRDTIVEIAEEFGVSVATINTIFYNVRQDIINDVKSSTAIKKKYYQKKEKKDYHGESVWKINAEGESLCNFPSINSAARAVGTYPSKIKRAMDAGKPVFGYFYKLEKNMEKTDFPEKSGDI